MRVICMRKRTHVQNVVSVYMYDVVLDAPRHRVFFFFPSSFPFPFLYFSVPVPSSFLMKNDEE